MTTALIGDNTTGMTYTGSIDTELSSAAPTTNAETGTTYYASKYSVGDHRNIVIKFGGLSNITGPVTVSAATLYLYYLTGAADVVVSLYECLRAWVEAQATWNIYSTGNNWGTAGGTNASDRGSVIGTGTNGGSLAAGYYAYTGSGLVTLVQGWINLTTTNNGLHLERTDGADDNKYNQFTSSEGTDGQRPYLDVTYTAGGATGGKLLLLGAG